jgi:hypothetical protein
MAVVFAMLVGGGAGTRLVPFQLVLVLGVGGVLLFRRRAVRTVDVGWSGGPVLTTPIADIPRLPAARPRTGRGSLARSLARVEARELFSSPWFAAGIGFWLMLYFVLAWVAPDDAERSWVGLTDLAALMCHPFAGMAVIAAHRNRTRSTRDGCDEMFDACPADGVGRTSGHLLTAWIGGLVCIVAPVLLGVIIAARNPRTYGPLTAGAAAALLGAAVIGVGAVVLGVTLGRWLRWTLAPFAAVGLVAFLGAQLNEIGSPGWAPDRLLATFIAQIGIDTLFFTRPVWGHLAWLGAVTVVVGALGLLRRGSRTPQLIAGIAAIVAVAAGLSVIRPISTSAATTIAARIVNPLDHATCRPAGPGVRTCAYVDYAELAERTAAAVTPVARAVPAGVLDDVVFLTYFHQRAELLQAEVRTVVAGRRPVLPENTLRLRFHSHPDNFLAARFRLAAFATGLPTETDRDGLPAMVAGQARGVVVLWLAAQGMNAHDASRLVSYHESSDSNPDVTDRGAVWPGGCHDEDGVLQWAPKDLAAARSLLALPQADVERVITQGWTRFVASTATTDDLLTAAGVAPLGPPESVQPRVFTC